MANTTNFGWETPDDTDLVKDGALAMRTLGNAIDTSLVDLKGGTTGQVLSKNTNTDMDFVWTTPNVGDITEVQAGTGISVASGTGPIPVVTNTVATAFDAKGDLVVGTGADTFSRLAVGTNNQVLTADSSTATGLKWAAAAGGGKVLQVVSSTYGTEVVSSSTTLSDTGLTVTITPSATSSKVLILVTQSFQVAYNAGNQAAGGFVLLRGSTQIFESLGSSNLAYIVQANGATEIYYGGYASMAYLDSPNTTSATTYKTQQRIRTNGSIESQKGGADSTIVALEIGA